MERKIKKDNTVKTILTGDWHLRDDQPKCRVDDFWEAQILFLRWMKELQEKYKCPVLHSGDLFHHWKPSPALLNMLIDNLPAQFYTILGNHDLPKHQIDLYDSCGVAVLERAGALSVLWEGSHWEKELSPLDAPGMKDVKYGVWHVMTFSGKLPWPGCEDMDAETILKKHKNFDLIHTGHNHKPIHVTASGRTLYNPGAPLRQSIAQIEYDIQIGLYTDQGKVIEVPVPAFTEQISDEHITGKKGKDDRFRAFIEQAKVQNLQNLDFRTNLDLYIKSNNVHQAVKQLIFEALEG